MNWTSPSPPAPSPAPPPQARSSDPVPPPSAPPTFDPADPEQLRQALGTALRQSAAGGLPRTLGALPVMATGLAFQDGILRWRFPGNVRNTVQDLEREQGNPHLLEALRKVLPGLSGMAIAFDTEATARPEDILRADPAFQRLLTETGGEILEVRRPD